VFDMQGTNLKSPKIIRYTDANACAKDRGIVCVYKKSKNRGRPGNLTMKTVLLL
jgi:hypothetical protein